MHITVTARMPHHHTTYNIYSAHVQGRSRQNLRWQSTPLIVVVSQRCILFLVVLLGFCGEIVFPLLESHERVLDPQYRPVCCILRKKSNVFVSHSGADAFCGRGGGVDHYSLTGGDYLPPIH